MRVALGWWRTYPVAHICLRSAVVANTQAIGWNRGILYAESGGVSMKRIRISSHLTRYSLLLIALFALAQMASATNSPLVLDLTGGGFATEPLSNAVAGWEFHLSAPLTIGAVGLWDEGDLPLSISHDVGLWLSDGTSILVATTITAAWRSSPLRPTGNGSSLPSHPPRSSRATMC